MPRVPTYDNFQVEPAGFPSARFTGQDVPNPGAAQMQQTGQDMQQAGGRLGGIVHEMMKEQNAARVDDAINKAKDEAMRLQFDSQTGYLNQKGQAALERQSGKALHDEYGEQLQTKVDEIAAGLGNETQRIAFSRAAGRMMGSFREDAMRHTLSEFRTFKGSTIDGIIATRKNEISLGYTDPNKVDQAINGVWENGVLIQRGIKQAIYEKAKMLGKDSAEFVEAAWRDELSDAHTTAIKGALRDKNVLFAEKYLKEYGTQISGKHQLELRAQINHQVDSRVAMSTVDTVMGKFSSGLGQTSDFDRIVNITMQTESNGRRYGPDGKLLESPKGAKGEMQVLDGTNTDPGFGVTPAKDNSPEERARVGRDYMSAMLKRYGGDRSKAWAAYNAGPGRLDEALAASEKDGIDWLDKLPKETQNYVTKNEQAYRSGSGETRKVTLKEVHDSIRSTLGTNNPERLNMALDESTRRFGEEQAAVKQREEEAVANAMRELPNHGWRYSDLPAEMVAAIPPARRDDVRNYAVSMHKGDNITSPALYQRLSNPDALRSYTDDQFYALRPELSDADFRHFSAQRQAAKSGQSGDLNTSAINTTVDRMLRQLEINPKPKDTDHAAAARVGSIRSFVDKYVANIQLQRGKKLSDIEVDQEVTKLFATRGEFTKSFLGVDMGSFSKPYMSMKATDIPDEVLTELKADFSRRGIRPSDADLIGAYWQLRFTK